MATGFFYKETSKEKGDSHSKTERKPKPEQMRELPSPLLVRVPKKKDERKINNVFNSGKPQLEMDIEVYSNYFLVKFFQPDGQMKDYDYVGFAPLACNEIKKQMKGYEIVTFNGNHFDMPLLNYALTHDDCTNADLKDATNELIKSELPVYKFEDKHNLSPMKGLDHIDLKQLTHVGASLKICGARLHCKRLQDLPYPEDTVLTNEQMDTVSEYCSNDLDITRLLKDDLREEIDLRRVLTEQYGVDMRSRSDAQIAEEIFKAEVKRIKGWDLKRPRDLRTTKFCYQIPDFISFQNEKLNSVLDILRQEEFVASPSASGISMPKQLEDMKITLGGSVYRMGIGGLHSCEKSAFHLADENMSLWDFDVTGYYPSIILQCGLYPKAIGKIFLDIYRDIVEERVAAKRAGEKVKADGLKITANGTFGKLGSPYSVLYAPELMIQVTLTGQLALLMLIEMFESHGLSIISGNTDGVIVKCDKAREKEMFQIVRRWENRTGFEMESTQYAGLWSRDVNNYIAIGTDGKVKLKGAFAYGSRRKNPEHDVCTDALVAYLRDGVPIEETVKACDDIRKFITVRQVKGGAVKGAEYLGKAVRWYYAKDEKGTINYKTNNNKVPLTDGARPIMTLPDRLPDDVDYDWYVRKCKEMFY